MPKFYFLSRSENVYWSAVGQNRNVPHHGQLVPEVSLFLLKDSSWTRHETHHARLYETDATLQSCTEAAINLTGLWRHHIYAIRHKVSWRHNIGKHFDMTLSLRRFFLVRIRVMEMGIYFDSLPGIEVLITNDTNSCYCEYDIILDLSVFYQRSWWSCEACWLSWFWYKFVMMCKLQMRFKN